MDSGTWTDVIGFCGRTMLAQIANLFPMMILMQTILKRRNSNIYIAVILMFRGVVITCLLNQILGFMYGQEYWWKVLYFTVNVFGFMLNIVLFNYVYSDSALKVLLGSILAEIVVSGITVGGLVIVDVLTGREQIAEYTGRLRVVDFLVPFIAWGIFYVVYRLLKPLFLRYRSWKPKFVVFWWVLFGAYALFGVISAVPKQYSSSKVIRYMFLYPYILFILLLLAFVIVHISLQKKRQEEEKQYLNQMQRMAEVQYHALQGQILQMNQNREMIDEKMKKFTELKTSSEQNESAKRYLEELEQEYQSFNSGIYSDNMLIDTMLCRKADECSKMQVKKEFSVQTQITDLPPEHELYTWIWQLLENGIRENMTLPVDQRILVVRIAKVKNQMVILVTCGCGKQRLLSVHRWKMIAKKMCDVQKWNWETDRMTAVLSLDWDKVS